MGSENGKGAVRAEIQDFDAKEIDWSLADGAMGRIVGEASKKLKEATGIMTKEYESVLQANTTLAIFKSSESIAAMSKFFGHISEVSESQVTIDRLRADGISQAFGQKEGTGSILHESSYFPLR